MKFECLIALLVWSSLDSSIAYSFPSRSNHVSCRTSSDNWSTTQLNADESGKARRRRIKGSSLKKNSVPSSSNVTTKTTNTEATSNIFAAADRLQPINVEEKEFSFGEFTNRLSTLVARVDQKEAEKERSLLPPLSGTVAERQAKYNEKNPFVRFFEEQTAPTLPGEEPKSIKLAKTVAWAGVLTLAFIELIVSVKVGGMPFELGKVNFGGGEQTFIVPKAPPVPTYDTTPFDSTLTGPRSL